MCLLWQGAHPPYTWCSYEPQVIILAVSRNFTIRSSRWYLSPPLCYRGELPGISSGRKAGSTPGSSLQQPVLGVGCGFNRHLRWDHKRVHISIFEYFQSFFLTLKLLYWGQGSWFCPVFLTDCIKFLTFYFEIISNWQKSCKNSPKGSCISFPTPAPQRSTFYHMCLSLLCLHTCS